MRKIKLLLASVLCIAGFGTAQADIITAASQLSNSKVYTIETTRGYMTLNTAGTQIVSSHSSTMANVNSNAATDDESKQFGILLIDGKYFIYSPKVNKFAELSGWNLGLYASRGTALTITTDGAGNPDGSTLRFFAYGMGSEGYNKFCLNNNNSGDIVLNSYVIAEAGNTVTIKEVEGVTLDTDAALAVWNGTPEYFDPHKVYNITNKRITKWTANEAGTGLTGTSTYTTASDAYQQFAFIKYDGKPYLYNVGTKKFVATDGTLTPNKTDAATIGLWHTGDANYPYCFFIEERGLLFNAQGGGGFAINSWNSGHDDGNKHNLAEVAGVDAYNEMLAYFEIPSWEVTYNIYYNGEKIGEETKMSDKDAAAALSSAWNNGFVTFTYEPATITDGVTEVTATVNWTGPTIYPDYESIVWKNLYIDRTENDGSKVYLTNTGSAPNYLVKNPTDKQRASDAYQWGFVGNPYQLKIYNKLSGSAQTLHPNSTIEMADGDSYWSIKISYADGFMIGVTGAANNFINQSGGYNATKLGYWSSTTDKGNVFHTADVPEIPVTNVYYDITFNGAVVNTAVVAGLEVGEAVPAMPTTTLPDYTTVTAPDVTGQTVTENMHIEVPATWNGPFELSTDVATAHWYDMAVRGTWYVTSDQKDDAGALLTVNANALGLGEDAYQWAFIGDPWHIQVFNKAEANNFGYPTQANGAVPSFQTDTYYWTVKASTSSIANSFVLNVPGTNLYINQFGGAGGPLKFWDSANNISDGGSAFTVFDVPTNFAPYVESEIAPYFETGSKYFVFTDEVAATVGYNAAYKESCPFETYKAMKQALAAIDMSNLTNFVLPETGYYTLKNRYYDTYMGIDPADAALYCNVADASEAKQIVKLTKTGDKTYTIGLMGKYAPATVAQSEAVSAEAEAGTYTVVVPTVGYAAFQADIENNMSVLHRNGAGIIVGWEAAANASQWIVEDATSIDLTVGETGYATTYLPFPVTAPEGVTVYTGTIGDNESSQWLTLSELGSAIPEATPVILKAEAKDYTFTIGAEDEYDGDGLKVYKDIEIDGQKALVKAEVGELTDNALKGTFEPIDAVDKYILAKPEPTDEVGFYKATTGKIAACKAYLEVASGVKAFYFNFDDATGIKDLKDANDLKDAKVIYNIAGQRLQKTQKGINIVNGKKIVMK